MLHSFALLTTRRFVPQFVCMALGAFNDNYYKSALIILITYVLSDALHMEASTLISIAAAVFILPFFLFSSTAGALADRYAKYKLVRLLKLTELVLIIFAALALMVANVWLLLTILFLLGTQAAFFGPVKYAILPELLREEELLSGNGLVEAGTFLSILLGTSLGALLILTKHGVEFVAISMIALSIIGVVASLYVPATTALNPNLRPSYNIVLTTWAMIRHAFSTRALLIAIIGISWFWAIGVTYLTQLPIFTKQIVGGDETIVTFFNGIFSIGIGIGAIACQHLLMGRVSLKYAPWSLLIIALAGVDLYIVSTSLGAHDAALITIEQYFRNFADYRIALDLAALSIAGGVFVVPLYTTLQIESEANARARTIASNNVMNALFMAVASVMAVGFYATNLAVEHVLLIFSLLSLPLIAWLYRYNR